MATGGGDLRAQRIDATGTAQWSAGGELVRRAAAQGAVVATDDGSGGAVFAWEDVRTGTTDVYAQRVDGAGAMQWAANGIVVCGASSYQFAPAIASDGQGGAIPGLDRSAALAAGVYAQRIDATGAASWTADGVKATNGAVFQEKAAIVSDGAGGAIVVWSDCAPRPPPAAISTASVSTPPARGSGRSPGPRCAPPKARRPSMRSRRTARAARSSRGSTTARSIRIATRSD